MKRNIIAISLMAAGLFTFGNVYATGVDEELNKCDESDYTEVCEIDEENVTITLKKDLPIQGPIHIQYGKNVTIDLNGNDLIFTKDGTDANGYSFIQVENGNLTITGSGTIATSHNSVIRATGAAKKSITIDKDVTVKTTETEGGKSYAINLSNSTNTTLDVYGTVIAPDTAISTKGNQQSSLDCPTIHIYDGAKITSTRDNAIYLPGYAQTTIDAATITGPTGIAIKSGVLNLNNTTITATGAAKKVTPSKDGITGNGAAIQVENVTGLESNYNVDNGDKQIIIININGGTYTSKHNSVLVEYGKVAKSGTALEELTIKDATFESKDDNVDVISLPEKTELKNFISGGKFLGKLPAEFTNYVAEGLEVEDDGTIVDPLAPTNPSNPTNPEQTGNQENGNGSNTGDNTIDDSPQTYDGIMSYVTMAITSVGAVALSLKKVLSR